jgi:hypothetical protein
MASVIITLLIFADWAHDQYARLDPEIHPRDTLDPLSFEVPFYATNNSAWISMDNVNISCIVDLFHFIDADHKTGLFGGSVLSPEVISIRHNAPTAYHCDASRVVHLYQMAP